MIISKIYVEVLSRDTISELFERTLQKVTHVNIIFIIMQVYENHSDHFKH